MGLRRRQRSNHSWGQPAWWPARLHITAACINDQRQRYEKKMHQFWCIGISYVSLQSCLQSENTQNVAYTSIAIKLIYCLNISYLHWWCFPLVPSLKTVYCWIHPRQRLSYLELRPDWEALTLLDALQWRAPPFNCNVVSSCLVSSSTKCCPCIGMYPVLSVPVTSTSVHYTLSVQVWHSLLLYLLPSVSLAHILIIATTCYAKHFSATLIVSKVCRTHSLVRSVPLSFGGRCTGCRSANVLISSSALSPFRAIHTGVPSYLASDIQHHQPLCSGNTIVLHRPHVSLDFHKHSFAVSAPAVWNNMPAASASLDILKSAFKDNMQRFFYQIDLK